MEWTNEDVRQLTAYREDGYSPRQIAARMPEFSRNAIISKIHRLGLTGMTKTIKRTDPNWTPPMPKAPKSDQHVNAGGGLTRKLRDTAARMKKALPAVKPEPAPVVKPIPSGVTFDDLEPHHCRFAVTERMPHIFCGGRREDGAYCREHASVCFRGMWNQQPRRSEQRKVAA